MDTPTSPAGALRRARGQLGWDQDDLARELGVKQQTVSSWERGKRIPPGRCAEIARLLPVTEEELTLERAAGRNRLSVVRAPESHVRNAPATAAPLERFLELLEQRIEHGPLSDVEVAFFRDVAAALGAPLGQPPAQ